MMTQEKIKTFFSNNVPLFLTCWTSTTHLPNITIVFYIEISGTLGKDGGGACLVGVGDVISSLTRQINFEKSGLNAEAYHFPALGFDLFK